MQLAELLEIVQFSAITVGAYVLSLEARRRRPGPFTTPVFFSTALIVLLFVILGLDFRDYRATSEVLTALLGPATVALALPLYRNRRILREHAAAVLLGIGAGTLATMAAAIVLARLCALGTAVTAALSIKSATVPIAIAIAPVIGADPALTAAFVIATGIAGTVLGPLVLDRVGVKNPLARGLALGTISHGQGTAQAALESELAGAVASVAMGLAAIFTSLLAPWLAVFFG